VRKPGQIFVTGATGYLGAHFLDRLQKTPWRIIALVRKVPLRVPRRGGKRVRWVKGDLLKPKPWLHHLKDCSAVVHLATVSLPECDQNPDRGGDVIVRGSRLLFDAAREKGIQRFIQVSTAEVYGSPPHGRITKGTPLAPQSLYGFFKACADLYVLSHGDLKDMSVGVLRFSNLYGTSADGNLPATVLSSMAKSIHQNGTVLLHGSVKNSRDFLHVQDAVGAIILALKTKSLSGAIDIGSGRGTTLRHAAQILAKKLGKPLRIQLRPREGRVRRTCVDLRNASRILGFRPKISMDRGLGEMVRKVVSHEP
jgi:nucleoside-diphosphate-sugar epimerase